MAIIEEHRLVDATWRQTINWDERPDWVLGPELVVIHCMSLPEGEFGTGAPTRLFCNVLDATEHPSFCELADLRVSAHALILRGGQVEQFVRFDQRAWHAGVSSWRGRDNCNDFSIGIELEGSVSQGYTEAQYAALFALCRALMMVYPHLGADTFVGHSDVAPGRKQDPGRYFDWIHFYRTLHQGLYRESS